MRILIILALLLSATPAAAEKAGLPRVRSDDRVIVVRAQPVQCVDNAGELASCGGGGGSSTSSFPSSGVDGRVITKTALPANTSRVICPANDRVFRTEIQISGSSLGLGLNGQTLTAGNLGVSSSAPDEELGVSLAQWVSVVAPTNAITGYGPAQIVSCIQHLRPIAPVIGG